MTRVDGRLAERGMKLKMTKKAKELLADRGYDPAMGARPLRRVIQRDIEDQISERILFSQLKEGETVTVDVKGTGDKAEFTFKGSASGDVGTSGIVEKPAEEELDLAEVRDELTSTDRSSGGETLPRRADADPTPGTASKEK